MDLQIHWYALYLSIIEKIPVDDALEKMGILKLKNKEVIKNE